MRYSPEQFISISCHTKLSSVVKIYDLSVLQKLSIWWHPRHNFERTAGRSSMYRMHLHSDGIPTFLSSSVLYFPKQLLFVSSYLP